MKQVFLSVLFATVIFTTQAQLVAKSRCDVITVDIIDGKVNSLKPNARFDEIKEKLPCFTATEAEGGTAKCGASVFYKDKDLYFYTDRDYIEIKEKFQGKFTQPIMGAARNSLFKILGNPKVKDDEWEAFQMSYGTLVLHYNKMGKVNLVQFSTKSTETLSLCE
ncbi:MAG: hypothetical protein ABIU63_13015 [Chitinophagaceae bacterium]